MEIKDYYESYWLPKGYGSNHSGPDPGLLPLLQSNVTKTGRCLDLGCGNGRANGLWMKEHASSYVGADISENAVSEARARGLDARVIEDAASLPFPDDSFDVAICTEVFEHLFAPHLAANEILRVLRPGGVLIVTVPNIAYWRRRVDLSLGRWHPMGDSLAVQQPWRDPHLRFFTLAALKRMLVTVGFYPVETGGHGGAFARDVPVIRRLLPGNCPSAIYRSLEHVTPSLFALRLHAVATKPTTRGSGRVRGVGGESPRPDR